MATKATPKPKPVNVSGLVATLMHRAESLADDVEHAAKAMDGGKLPDSFRKDWAQTTAREARRLRSSVRALAAQLKSESGAPAKVVRTNPGQSWPKPYGRGIIGPNHRADLEKDFVDQYGFRSTVEALGVIATEKEADTRKEAPELSLRFEEVASILVGASFDLADLEV